MKHGIPTYLDGNEHMRHGIIIYLDENVHMKHGIITHLEGNERLRCNITMQCSAIVAPQALVRNVSYARCHPNVLEFQAV